MLSVSFDGANKLIVISDTGNVTITAKELYSLWKDWVLDNPQWEPAFRSFGGDPLGGGAFAGDYYFLNNVAGWKIKPQEKNHTLTINGNLYGEDPDETIFEPTIGNYIVSIKQNLSSLTQTVSSGSGLSTEQALQLLEIYRIHGLEQESPLTVSKTKRIVGDIDQTITPSGDDEYTLTRS